MISSETEDRQQYLTTDWFRDMMLVHIMEQWIEFGLFDDDFGAPVPPDVKKDIVDMTKRFKALVKEKSGT